MVYRREPPPIPPTLVTCPKCETVYEGLQYGWLTWSSRWPDENGWCPPRHNWCDSCVREWWEDYVPTPAQYI